MDADYEIRMAIPSPDGFQRCHACGRNSLSCRTVCRFCKAKVRDRRMKTGRKGGRPPRKLIMDSGVPSFRCSKCKNVFPLSFKYGNQWICKDCGHAWYSKAYFNRKRLDAKRKISWNVALKRESSLIESKDIFAVGFDAHASGKPESCNKYPPGSVRWYLFREGYMESKSPRIEPFRFMSAPADEPFNPAGMSGQRVTTFYKRSSKNYRFGTAKMYEDDESLVVNYPEQLR